MAPSKGINLVAPDLLVRLLYLTHLQCKIWTGEKTDVDKFSRFAVITRQLLLRNGSYELCEAVLEIGFQLFLLTTDD